ncbi:MAG: peptidoglycan DD-metalloendopeptidase family protein [Myxococcota bacterium]
MPDLPPEEPPDPLHGEVEPGDSLSRILNRVGLDSQEIHKVSEAMTPLMDPATIRVGQRYDFVLDEKENLVSFSFRRTATESVKVVATEDGTFTAELEEVQTEVREEEIGGTIESSLWGALTKRGHSAALVDVIVETFAYDIDFFTATRKGDQFRIIVERHEVDGELVRYGRVLAAEYLGSSNLVVLWWKPSAKGEGRYVNAEGKGVSRTLLKTPLKYARISSGFDPKRMHPVLHRQKSHNGVDYAAPEGTPIWAAADGKIVHRKLAGGAGNMVIVRHDGGLTTLYMHMSKFAEGQRVGMKVKAKTVIGYVGSTGLATGPHLHFGVKKNGRYVDPTAVESVRGSGVGKSDRSKFKKFFATWRGRLDAIATD